LLLAVVERVLGGQQVLVGLRLVAVRRGKLLLQLRNLGAKSADLVSRCGNRLEKWGRQNRAYANGKDARPDTQN